MPLIRKYETLVEYNEALKNGNRLTHRNPQESYVAYDPKYDGVTLDVTEMSHHGGSVVVIYGLDEAIDDFEETLRWLKHVSLLRVTHGRKAQLKQSLAKRREKRNAANT